MNWLQMAEIEFDVKAAPTRAARQLVATAGETLFPRLLPVPSRRATPAAVQLPGQDSLFGEEA